MKETEYTIIQYGSWWSMIGHLLQTPTSYIQKLWLTTCRILGAGAILLTQHGELKLGNWCKYERIQQNKYKNISWLYMLNKLHVWFLIILIIRCIMKGQNKIYGELKWCLKWNTKLQYIQNIISRCLNI